MLPRALLCVARISRKLHWHGVVSNGVEQCGRQLHAIRRYFIESTDFSQYILGLDVQRLKCGRNIVIELASAKFPNTE